MRLLTEDAKLVCSHEMGIVGIQPGQDFVTIDGRRVLIDNDPETRPISGCPYSGATVKPCTTTLPVEVGYSSLVAIGGRRVCLDTVRGLTDGNPPPRFFEYFVRQPGQNFVDEP